MKRLLAAAAFATACCPALAWSADPPQTARIWTYGSLTTMFSPEWGLLAMPGTRYEVSRSVGPEKRHYFDELFVGPVYVKKFGNLTLKVGLWYYYMGYPIRAKDDYEWSHNLELVPQVDYRVGRFTLTNRIIFHNTFYASGYRSTSEKLGWGTVLREMVQATFWVTRKVGIIAADEPFIGLIEDAEATSSPIGYWSHGLRLNRIYGGVTWQITPRWTLTPQYVYETSYDKNGNLQEVGHYLFTTLSCSLKAF